MEFSCLLDSNSLDLNANPFRVLDEAPLPSRPLPKQEAESKLIECSRNATVQEKRGVLMEELNRVSEENKKLTEMLTVMCENYTQLKNQLVEYTSKNPNTTTTSSRKRKLGESSIIINSNVLDGTSNVGPSESSSSEEDSSKKLREEELVKAKISQVHVRTEASDTSLTVKDGYQWRKYGQKVTRDNPCPRAYFKCSFAPTCPVKKKVQRSIEDQSVVVATYEGEHNHPHPSKVEANRSSALGNVPCSAASVSASAASTITLDLTKPRASLRGKTEAPHLQHYLVEQMASTLTKDPSFKAALAAAISGNFLQQNNQKEKW